MPALSMNLLSIEPHQVSSPPSLMEGRVVHGARIRFDSKDRVSWFIFPLPEPLSIGWRALQVLPSSLYHTYERFSNSDDITQYSIPLLYTGNTDTLTTPITTHAHAHNPTRKHLPFDIREVLEIQTAKLIFLTTSQMHPGDPVDDEEKDDADDERPYGAGRSSSELITHLLPVTIPPTPGIGVGFAVEGGHERGGEESGENVADEASDTVDGEDIETLVYGNQMLVFYCEEGA